MLPSSQSDTCTTQGSPHFFRSLAFGGGAAGGSSQGSSPQHASTPVSTSASPLPDASSGPAESAPATAGSSAQQNPVLLTNTSNLSPCLIPSTVMSLSQLSPTSSSLQGTTVPIPHSAPHSPPLPHSAPLSRAMTPVQLLHQQVGPGGSNTLSTSHNPWFLKTTEMSATATLPLPRRPASEMRLGGFQGESSHPSCSHRDCTRKYFAFAHFRDFDRRYRESGRQTCYSPQQAPVFPGCCLYRDPYTWRPCSLTLREPPQVVAQGAGLAYCTSCPVTTSPCSSRSPETDGTTDKTNEPGGTRVGIPRLVSQNSH